MLSAKGDQIFKNTLTYQSNNWVSVKHATDINVSGHGRGMQHNQLMR